MVNGDLWILVWSLEQVHSGDIYSSIITRVMLSKTKELDQFTKGVNIG